MCITSTAQRGPESSTGDTCRSSRLRCAGDLQ
jgi:hypothetical protein